MSLAAACNALPCLEWFTDWYCSNKADLKLLEEMGITPDISFRQRKHSVKTVGLMVLGVVRMKGMVERWAESRRVQESLVRKLEGMKGRKLVR